jgi:hypothetical protein
VRTHPTTTPTTTPQKSQRTAVSACVLTTSPSPHKSHHTSQRAAGSAWRATRRSTASSKVRAPVLRVTLPSLSFVCIEGSSSISLPSRPLSSSRLSLLSLICVSLQPVSGILLGPVSSNHTHAHAHAHTHNFTHIFTPGAMGLNDDIIQHSDSHTYTHTIKIKIKKQARWS